MKKVVIGILAVILVIGAGVWLVKKKGNNQTAQNQSTQSSQPTSTTTPASFNPQALDGLEYTATLTTVTPNGGNVSATVEYDKDTNAWHYSGQSDSSSIEAIYATDAYYIKTNGNWMKLPLTQASQSFNPSQYKYDQASLKDLQGKAQDKGTQNCPAGTCQVWEVSNYQNNDKITFYVDKKTNRISQIVTEAAGGKTTIVYSYKDVTVDIPTNAVSAPGA